MCWPCQRRDDVNEQIQDKEQKLNKIRSERQETEALINALNLPILHSELEQTKSSVSQGHQDLKELKKQELEIKEHFKEKENTLQSLNDKNLQLEQENLHF